MLSCEENIGITVYSNCTEEKSIENSESINPLSLQKIFLLSESVRKPLRWDIEPLNLKTVVYKANGSFLDNLFSYKSALIDDFHYLQKIRGYSEADTLFYNFPEIINDSLEEIRENSNLRNMISQMDERELRFLLNALYFKPFWVRDLSTFKYEKSEDNYKVTEKLFNHLFGIFDTPLFLINVWNENYLTFHYLLYSINSMCLSVIIARGESFRKAVKTFKWNVNKGIYKYLFQIDESSKLFEGFFLAHILQLGGTREDFCTLAHNLEWAWDPLEDRKEELDSDIKFIFSCIKWFLKNKPASVNKNDTYKIMKYAFHRYTENSKFPLSRYSYTSLLNKAIEYNIFLNDSDPYSNPAPAWDKKFLDWEYIDNQKNIWNIK